MNTMLTTLKRASVSFLLVLTFFSFGSAPCKANCDFMVSNDRGITEDSVVVFDGYCGTTIANDLTIINTSDHQITVALFIDGGFLFHVDQSSVVIEKGSSQKVTVSLIANSAVDVT